MLLTCWQCFSCFNVLLWFLSSFWPQLKRVQIRDMRKGRGKWNDKGGGRGEWEVGWRRGKRNEQRGVRVED